MWKKLYFLPVIMALLLAGCGVSTTNENRIPVTVKSVYDGDTMTVFYEEDGMQQEERVRFLLIDSSEMNHREQGKQAYSEEARDFVREMVENGDEIELEFDEGDKEDKYDRLLAYLFVDDVNVGEELIRNGLARVAYVYPPNTKYLELYEDAEAEAKQAEIGIWSIPDFVTERGFDQEAAENAAIN